MNEEERILNILEIARLQNTKAVRYRKQMPIVLLVLLFILTFGGISILKVSGRLPTFFHKPVGKATSHTNQPKPANNKENSMAESIANGLCGNSSSEAKALGCTFDQLTWSWYPSSCPHYANDEFINAEKWTFYLDKYGHQQPSDKDWERVMDNKLRLYGERREHITHCVYLMLSVGQIMRDGTPYAKKLLDYEHLAHCAELMLSTLRKDKHWHSMDTLVPFVDYDVTC
jgi:hypothetical protein